MAGFGGAGGFGGSEGAWGSVGSAILDIAKPVLSNTLDRAINGKPKTQAPIVIQAAPPPQAPAPTTSAGTAPPPAASGVPTWAWVAGAVVGGGIVLTLLVVAIRR